MDDASRAMATIGPQQIGPQQIRPSVSAMDNGFAAIFGSMYNNGAEETPLQGLCFDLINLCQPMDGRNRKSMSVFGEILNAIPEVLNERKNTATTSDISQSPSEVDSWVSGIIGQGPSRTSTFSTPFTVETPSDTSQGEPEPYSDTDSNSTHSIPTNFLPVTTRHLQQRSDVGQITNSMSFSGSSSIPTGTNNGNVTHPPPSRIPVKIQGQGPCQSQLLGGDLLNDLNKLPVSISEDVYTALRQFGLEGCLMPPSAPSKSSTPHESNSFPRMASQLQAGGPGKQLQEPHVAGDNGNAAKDDWMSPLGISGTMLANLLSRFTGGAGEKEENLENPGGLVKGGTSDAESGSIE